MRNRGRRLEISQTNQVYLHNPKCKCGKIGFDKKGAQSKRNVLLKLGEVKTLRIYPCPKSGMRLWHLTSTGSGL